MSSTFGNCVWNAGHEPSLQQAFNMGYYFYNVTGDRSYMSHWEKWAKKETAQYLTAHSLEETVQAYGNGR